MTEPSPTPADPDREEPEIVPPGEEPVVPTPERPGPDPEPDPQSQSGPIAPHEAPLNSDASGNNPHGLAGGMGVSSERTGHAGPDAPDATHSTRSTTTDPVDEDDPPPEQRPGAIEENPVGIPPKPASRDYHGGQPGHSGAQGAP